MLIPCFCGNETKLGDFFPSKVLHTFFFLVNFFLKMVTGKLETFYDLNPTFEYC